MKYILILLLVPLVALFVWMMIQSAKEKDSEELENKKIVEVKKTEKRAVDAIKRECFEAYRQLQIDEQNYALFKAALSEKSGLYYIRELFAFRDETEKHRLMSHEYRHQLAERVLDPMKAAVSASCPFKNGEYTTSQTFDVFLTPEEYYDQQLSYRGSSAIYQTDNEFWKDRLQRCQEKRVKLANDSANAFWIDLWKRLKPLLEEAETTYRDNIENAASREAALLYTKDLTERIEQELFRSGISVMWYLLATPGEREKYFKTESSGTELPALVRESNGICYEKGRHLKNY